MNYNMLNDFDDFFNFSHMALLPIIIFCIIFIVILSVIITIIVKAVKNSKETKKIEDTIIEKIKDMPNKENDDIVICEYCGSANDIKNKSCTNCGAKLNYTKKSR